MLAHNSPLRDFMRSVLLLIVVAAVGSAAELNPGPKTPLEVDAAYVDATNRNDLEAFLALYAPDIAKFKFPGTKASQGREHMREIYA